MEKAKHKHRHNDKNERVKYTYRIHKSRVRRKDKKTIIAELQHIREFELFTGFQGVECFNEGVADKYINHLLAMDKSFSYVNDNLRALREFLNWLERQRGYRSKINYNHIEYLHLTNNQRRSAKATDYKQSYTYTQVIDTTRKMPASTAIEKRNRAIISLQALCGLRPSELRTVRIKSLVCVDDNWFVDINPKYVQSKFCKARKASFMPLPEDIQNNVIHWRAYLIEQGFKPIDPLFPIIPKHFNQHHMLESHLTATLIKSNSTLRTVFKNAFESAGYEYINPHNFRHTLMRYAEYQTPAFLNAVRQSLGHESIDVSFNSYGHLSDSDQQRLFSEQRVVE